MAEAKTSEDTSSADQKSAPPADGKTTPPQTSTDDNTVIVSKTEYAELKRKEAMLGTAQASSANFESELKRVKAKGIEKETLQAPEIAEARSLITSKVLSNPDYLTLTSNNPELAKILTHQPWLLLDHQEFIDANDMAEQVINYLNSKVQVKKNTEAAEAEAAAKKVTTTDPKPAQPETTAPDGTVVDNAKKQKEAEKNMSVGERIANKIGNRINIAS